MNRLGLDDAAVIEASRAEPDRFASLFDRHAPYIHRYLARRVGRQAADDLVAETFLVAFRKRERYDARHHDARPWLYGIATNLIAQHRREEARQFRLRQAAGPDPVQHDWAERSALDVTAQSLRAPLTQALARLARPDRDVLLLIAWEQLSYDEVARALNIPVGTVRSRLHRARTKIREALAGTPAAATYEEIRFLATTPGLTVDRHVRDVSGRPGIGVVWRFYGSKAMNIFDPRTFAYLGLTTWGEQGQVGGAALVQTAVVDQAGELP